MCSTLYRIRLARYVHLTPLHNSQSLFILKNNWHTAAYVFSVSAICCPSQAKTTSAFTFIQLRIHNRPTQALMHCVWELGSHYYTDVSSSHTQNTNCSISLALIHRLWQLCRGLFSTHFGKGDCAIFLTLVDNLTICQIFSTISHSKGTKEQSKVWGGGDWEKNLFSGILTFSQLYKI